MIAVPILQGTPLRTTACRAIDGLFFYQLTGNSTTTVQSTPQECKPKIHASPGAPGTPTESKEKNAPPAPSGGASLCQAPVKATRETYPRHAPGQPARGTGTPTAPGTPQGEASRKKSPAPDHNDHLDQRCRHGGQVHPFERNIRMETENQNRPTPQQ